MVERALNWITAAVAAWKAIITVLVFAAACGAGYTKMHYDAKGAVLRDIVQNKRLDNLEKGQDLTHKEIVQALEKLRLARVEVHKADNAATDDYRKEMRDRMREQEKATSAIQATLEQIEKRLE
jgi:hypothetical protein